MKKQPCEPQVGADIELFLYDTAIDEYIPCIGVVPGTKDKPFIPNNVAPGYAMQEDNVMLEYNIPPVKSGDALDATILTAMGMVDQNIPETYRACVLPEMTFSDKQLDHPQAKVIGCEPDFDAYAGGQQRVVSHVLGNKRACGGHIHLGGNFNCPDFVAALFADLLLGVRAATYPRKENSRTEWYGKPGIYRPKSYGIEYRTPDNSWTETFESRWEVGSMAMELTDYLTRNDAETIRTAFNAITWTRVRDFMTPKKRTKGMYDVIINEAQAAGVI